jgi:hypothetical protein
LVKWIFNLVRRGYELAGAVALTFQLAGSGALAILAADVADLSWPLRLLLGFCVFVLMASAILVAYAVWRERSKQSPESIERLGIKNRHGGKSVSKGALFGPGLDTAIDNSEGGESRDENSIFL